eukprot:8256207-Lingulodinium_polyedra.AAC.1
MEGCDPTVECAAHRWCSYKVGALGGKPSGCVYHCLSNLEIQARSCACPKGATHGIAWGNRSFYGREPGS